MSDKYDPTMEGVPSVMAEVAKEHGKSKLKSHYELSVEIVAKDTEIADLESQLAEARALIETMHHANIHTPITEAEIACKKQLAEARALVQEQIVAANAYRIHPSTSTDEVLLLSLKALRVFLEVSDETG